MSALSIHQDISLKLVLAPEVETSVKSVGLAVPQISVRPVELSRPTIATLTNCLTILSLVSQSSLDTSRDGSDERTIGNISAAV